MLGDGRGTRVKKRRERGSAPKPTTRSPAGRAEHHFWQLKKARLLQRAAPCHRPGDRCLFS